MERRKVIDLLPDREAATLTDWLFARPSVETVARDRPITYRNGITMGRPYAVGRLCFRKGKLSEEELEMLFNARVEWDEFDRAFPLAEEFVKIVCRQRSMSIGLWIVKAFNSGVKELKSFVNGLQKDFLAVKEATVSEWSNGQTETQVNRLKVLKRQIYGGAKFDLLKARVLNPA